jgi:hypothetical protein
VERSIALPYEAVEQFPDRKVHITNELINNQGDFADNGVVDHRETAERDDVGE